MSFFGSLLEPGSARDSRDQTIQKKNSWFFVATICCDRVFCVLVPFFLRNWAETTAGPVKDKAETDDLTRLLKLIGREKLDLQRITLMQIYNR